MVTPAMELATKIPDVHVQVWATALLRGIFRFFILHIPDYELHLIFSFRALQGVPEPCASSKHGPITC